MTTTAIFCCIIFCIVALSSAVVSSQSCEAQQTRGNVVQTAKGRRDPSWCDRIVYAGLASFGRSFESHVYAAIENQHIRQSDHDLVFSYFSYMNSLHALVTTWNIGDWKGYQQHDALGAWQQIVCSMQTKFHTEHRDGGWNQINLFHFTFQELSEDAVKKGDFAGHLKTALGLQEREWIQETHSAGMANYHVLSIVFYKHAEIARSPTKPVVDKMAFNALGLSGNWATKTAMVVGAFVRKSDPSVGLYFGAGHLPIETGEKDLGYEARKKAMDKIKNHWKAMEDKRDNNKHVYPYPLVLAGDLNFRAIEGEQLKRFMDTSHGDSDRIVWREVANHEFNPTCKKTMA